MKITFKTSLIAGVAALGLAACEGPAENAMEDQGEMQAEMVDERVEAQEDAGLITEGQEDALTEQAEERADNMEAVGEAIDEGEVVPAQ